VTYSGGAPAGGDRLVDESGFAALVRSHLQELRAHCYRMVGALGEAEDLVQETFLRAWRERDTFDERLTPRVWLYRIATDTCLDTLAGRPGRVLPYDVASDVGGKDGTADPVGWGWLEPCPQHLLDPSVDVTERETIELAFLAAIQRLPPKQRAILILRDVLGWPASATGRTLGLSTTAVKSALQHARTTLRQRLPSDRIAWNLDVADAERETLRRYVEARRRDDRPALATVLAEDLRVEFPPLPRWVQGRETYLDGIDGNVEPDSYFCLETMANHQPAVAFYLRPVSSDRYRLRAVQVLRIADGRIVAIVEFRDPRVLDSFSPALPAELA
jgi:RNA polymerase sigma-70 factor (ECF subfamily)